MNYTLDGKDYKVEIIRKGNKNTYVRVKDDLTIYVTASYFVTKRQITNLLDSNINFLRKAIARKENIVTSETEVLYFGHKYDLIISNMFKDVEFTNNKIFASSMENVNKWILKEMKILFQERYNFYYNKFDENIPLYTLKLRTMKTRWGVCNRKSKTITLNTKLLQYDICCLDYVIVHELSHLIEFNHSAYFWKEVEKYYPNYKNVRKILKD